MNQISAFLAHKIKNRLTLSTYNSTPNFSASDLDRKFFFSKKMTSSTATNIMPSQAAPADAVNSNWVLKAGLAQNLKVIVPLLREELSWT
jgi:hypothetical protein